MLIWLNLIPLFSFALVLLNLSRKQKGTRKPTDAEVSHFKSIRNWMATTRNRSKKWDRVKEKWKIDLLTKEGFPLPKRNETDDKENASH